MLIPTTYRGIGQVLCTSSKWGVLVTVEPVQYAGVTSYTCVIFTSLSRNTLDLVWTWVRHVHVYTNLL